ncbi:MULTISPECIES: hypothetical protein [unclassified Nocardioides]|uniref:hypothetical protein n=1 Tax=unclassified Nocardioides TaxID=2615069 RepID=UPI000A42FF56|nr:MULTISPECIES: hypothetical protein [unclassified Nocardioides]
MRRLLLLPVVAIVALFAPLSPANADPYPPTVPTSCHVSVPSVVAGERVVLRVVVSASSNIAVTGTVEVTVSRRAAAARAARSARSAPWTTTVRYDGSPLRIVGPRLSRGDHVATIKFVPDGNTFTGCEDAVRFRVGGVRGTGDVGGVDGNLPDTGGPRLLVLLTGLGLLVAGAGFVRRSRPSAA